MTVTEHLAIAVDEIAATAAVIDEAQLAGLVELIGSARRVHLAGVGRSGLVAKAFAMRLMHIGLDVEVVGETTAPGIEAGDLLLLLSATGRGSAQTQAALARTAGATIAALTASADSALASEATPAVVIPARTRVATRQHAGSLFEQVSLLVADAVCAEIQHRLGRTDIELDRRHANLL